MGNKFWAFIHTDGEGNYGISFPDVLGCTSTGESVEEAVEQGRKALRSNLDARADEGYAPLASRTLDEILADAEIAEEREEALTIVEVQAAPKVGKSVRINVSVDEFQLERIDRAAKKQGMTRSRLMVEGALAFG